MSDAAPDKQGDPRIGRVIDERFRIVEHLGEGSTATVYRAESLDGGPDVAVKLVKTPSYQTPEDRDRRIARFKREANAISKLQHKNTVRLEHFGVTPGGQQYMVLEYLDGDTWEDRIEAAKAGGPGCLDLSEVADIGRHVALAMDEAHRIGIVHRDLKPANICLVERGARDLVKVVDFGAAALDPGLLDADGDHRKLTAMGATVGSAHYMSPEQSRGEDLTPKSDVYSLGIVLYEAITGDVPFSGSFVEIMAQHNFETPKRLRHDVAPKRVVETWQGLLDRMLSKTAEERPSMAEVAMELERVAEVTVMAADETILNHPAVPESAMKPLASARPRASSSGPLPAAPRRGSGMVIVLAVALLAAIAVGVFLALR